MKMKKIASLLLVLATVLTMTVTAFAAQEGTLNGGSITINDAVPGETYNIYQLLYLESYNAETNAYSYKANSAWKTWLETQTAYISFNEEGYVTWVEGAEAAAFAKLAQAQAATMTADGTAVAPAAVEDAAYSTVKFDDLKLGYYLVDTSLGALCSLDTTNPDVIMEEKNEVPTIDKQVKEDSDNTWGDENTAQIGDTVEFKTTIHAKKGAQNYVLHDEMSDGLTLNPDSISVAAGANTLVKGTDYTVVTSGLADNCDFHIVFAQAFLDSISTDTDIVVTYTAVLNEKAVISTDANTNKTKLNYGDKSETQWDETKTYTFKLDIVKTNSEKKLLTGAKFELYDAQTGGNKIALVKEAERVYRVATDAEKNAEGFVSAVIEAGIVTIKGLDANTTYWLEEIEAPAGFNKLAERVKVEIGNANLSTTFTGSGAYEDTMGGVQITNKSGTELPSTGGTGTTIFYVLGSILVVAAGVLLVTKKRMSDRA